MYRQSFFAVDANGKTRGFLSLDSLSQGKDAFIPMTEEERLSRPAMAEYAKNVYIGIADAGAEHCFETLLHGQTSSFGNYPIPQVKQYLGEREDIMHLVEYLSVLVMISLFSIVSAG